MLPTWLYQITFYANNKNFIFILSLTFILMPWMDSLCYEWKTIIDESLLNVHWEEVSALELKEWAGKVVADRFNWPVHLNICLRLFCENLLLMVLYVCNKVSFKIKQIGQTGVNDEKNEEKITSADQLLMIWLILLPNF